MLQSADDQLTALQSSYKVDGRFLEMQTVPLLPPDSLASLSVGGASEAAEEPLLWDFEVDGSFLAAKARGSSVRAGVTSGSAPLCMQVYMIGCDPGRVHESALTVQLSHRGFGKNTCSSTRRDAT